MADATPLSSIEAADAPAAASATAASSGGKASSPSAKPATSSRGRRKKLPPPGDLATAPVHAADAGGASERASSAPAAPAVGASAAIDLDKLSPAMRQYQQFKALHPGYVLFFRMGDFYEMFWDDAVLCNRVLGVTLTSRNKGAADEIPMAGVPFHAVEGYLRKMIAAGHKVAICEQVEDPRQAKGVVQREVVRLMTPGTLTDESMLESSAENHLAAVASGISTDGFRFSVAWVDLSTGACIAMSADRQAVLDKISQLMPSEVLIPELASGQPHEISVEIAALGIKTITARPAWQFSMHHAREQIQKQWSVTTAGGFGFADDDPALLATAAVLAYLEETQKTSLQHLRPLGRHLAENYLAIDPASWRALEIDRTSRWGDAAGSLVETIRRTRTPMGARLLRHWLRNPLRDIEHLQARQSAVAALVESPSSLKSIVERYTGACDVERVVGRLAVNRALPRDMAALSRCLEMLPELIDQLGKLAHADDVAPELAAMRPFCIEQCAYLRGALKPNPAAHLREGNVIADGFDADLDTLRDKAANS